jgi:sirohydrochlorin ferrochelatase
MDWCITARRQDANHHPAARVNGRGGKSVISVNAKPRQAVTLSAAGSSDPDGNKITYRWFQYLEAGSTRRTDILGKDTNTITFTTPNEPNKTLHIILELRDNGTPNLFTYRRIIVTITDPSPSP